MALNLVISNNSKNKESIYSENDFADIEFYSPNPLHDTIHLCDFLNSKDIPTNASEGVHDNTFKIFCHYYNVCDITFMPEEINNILPFVKIQNVKVIDPKFMFIDILRQLNDPMTSYLLKLEKTFSRTLKLLTYTSITFSQTKLKFNITNSTNIYKIIECFTNLPVIYFDTLAYNCYAKESGFTELPIVYLRCFLEDYTNNLSGVISQLKDYFKEELTYKEYYPFYEYLDRHVTIFLDKVPIISIYGTNKKCIPYVETSIINNKIRITSYFGSLLYLLILIFREEFEYTYYKSNSLLNLLNFTKYQFNNLLQMRKKYMTIHKYSLLLDDESNTKIKSIFVLFPLTCLDKIVDPLIENITKMKQRFINKQKVKFRYEPDNISTTEKENLLSKKAPSAFMAKEIKKEGNLILRS